MQDYKESEARRLRCRVVPPVVMPRPGPQIMAGKQTMSLEVQFHACDASECCHWFWTQRPKQNKLDERFNEEGRGCCSKDVGRFIAAKGEWNDQDTRD